jgi:hypothetical protein
MSDIETDPPVTPTVTDDDGTGRTGTRVNKAYHDAMVAAINHQVESATNPTLTPADIIDEVVAARGGEVDLDARLDLLALASSITTLITQTQLMGGLGAVNLDRNDDFLLWPDGDAAAALYYTLNGAGAAVARCGTGLGDTNRKVGDFCAKLTRSGTDCDLSQTLLSTAAFARADFLKGKYLTRGMWVKCSTPNIARLAIYDGVGTSYSSYHTGGGSWEWLALTRQIDSSATTLIVRACAHNSNASAYFSGGTSMLLGDSALIIGQYQPAPVQYGVLKFGLSGNLPASLTRFDAYEPARGGIVKDIQCSIKTPGTGRAVIFDVNTWDGAALTTMCTTKPQIGDGLARGGAQPDGTYARRCLRPTFGTSISAGGLLSVDLDQNGSGTAGADATVMVRTLQYATPLERFHSYND